MNVSFCHRGTSGFVVLAVDMTTGQQLAIKFISRGRQHVDVNMKEISRELLVGWVAFIAVIVRPSGCVLVCRDILLSRTCPDFIDW